MSTEYIIPKARGGIVGSSRGNLQEFANDPNDSSLLVRHGGKYSLATQQGRVFQVANQAAVATTAALATTWTGLAIGNPTNSGVNVSVLQVGFATSVIGPTLSAVGVMGGSGSITASLTPLNCLIGGVGSKINATAGQTISTPVLWRLFAAIGTAATTAIQVNGAFCYDVDGSIVLPPGYFMATYTTLANTAALVFNFVWEEIPINTLV